MVTGVLPARNETLAQQQLWITAFLGDLPAQQQLILRPYAEWRILRTACRNAPVDDTATARADTIAANSAPPRAS
ncbi:hypothetical protein [Nocardia nepalensis]|uniref:hypothetical protein n=1 Tax=Nocardia nepalensis TaxID=3375448 RepID=UPI003B67D0AA